MFEAKKPVVLKDGPEAGPTKDVAWTDKDRLTWAESVTVATPAHPGIAPERDFEEECPSARRDLRRAALHAAAGAARGYRSNLDRWAAGNQQAPRPPRAQPHVTAYGQMALPGITRGRDQIAAADSGACCVEGGLAHLTPDVKANFDTFLAGRAPRVDGPLRPDVPGEPRAGRGRGARPKRGAAAARGIDVADRRMTPLAPPHRPAPGHRRPREHAPVEMRPAIDAARLQVPYYRPVRPRAGVVELADTRCSGRRRRKPVGVQIPPPAPQ